MPQQRHCRAKNDTWPPHVGGHYLEQNHTKLGKRMTLHPVINSMARFLRWLHRQRSGHFICYFVYRTNLAPSPSLYGLLDQVMILGLQRRHLLRRSCIEVPRSTHVPLIPVAIAVYVLHGRAVDAAECQALIV